jgi:signal transduction histidine kinase
MTNPKIYEVDDVERTLGRIVVGYRGLAVGWAVLLVLVAETGDTSFARRWVPWVEVALIVAWFAWTVWLRGRRPAVLHAWWFLAVDLTIAIAVLLASWAAGDASVSLSGGYPLSTLAVFVYGRAGAGGIIAGTGLLAAALARRVGADEVNLAAVVSDIASWTFPAVVFSWATGVIRSFDHRRRRSDAALADERAERARVEERAEVAAHLHDSVLQTLALIQRSAEDADEVVTLARGQERELRGWLYGMERAPLGESLVGALEAVSAAIESESKVKVELISVGDTPMSEGVRSLTAAIRESITNAARHAGVDVVHVYSEVEDGVAEVFVRDRGSGFDLATVPADRAGVRESIIGRMDRAGGKAHIKSSTDRGTEVRLTLPVGEREDA